MEDKQMICRLLLLTLRATKDKRGVEDLLYRKIKDISEIVTIIYSDDTRKTLCVSMYSGFEMIQRILEAA